MLVSAQTARNREPRTLDGGYIVQRRWGWLPTVSAAITFPARQPATHPPHRGMSTAAVVVASGAGTAGHAATTGKWSAMAGLRPAAQPPPTAYGYADALSLPCPPFPNAIDQDNWCSAMVVLHRVLGILHTAPGVLL